MFFAAFLGVTLVPVLMVLLIRGKITPEIKNPANRFLIWAYQPLANFVLRYRLFTLACAVLLLTLTICPFKRLVSEFMPTLNEGTLLYMPTAIPGMSIAEAAKILQIQDRQLKKIPEAVTVFGKAGQADTPTDPAPLSMFETVVTLKPPEQWRKGMTWDKLLAELNANIKTPGMANIFWMPIQTRTEMLATGFRSVLGVKVFGPDLGEIQKLAVQIEKELSWLPNTRSAFAERTVGGYFLDFTVNREAAARYGLRVGDVNDIVESAIGGKNITTTVEGRERYSINARYARDFRQDIDALKRVLVPTPTGAQVPISLLADIKYKTGPPSVRSENGKLVGFVFVDVTTSDIDGYVRKASQHLSQRLQYPAGYYTEWAGQFQYLEAAKQRLKLVIPFTLLIIFVLLYINMRSITKTATVLLAVPFPLVGLLPIMWSPVMQAGADVMKRIATPMIGGVVTSAILELLIYPVIYVIWRRRELPDKTEKAAPFVPPELVPLRQMRSRMRSGLKWIALVIAMITIFSVGNFAWQRLRPAKTSGAPFVTQTVNDLTVNLINREGGLRKGDNEAMIDFRDRSGQLVDVGTVNFKIDMNIAGMLMHGGATIEPTNTAGRYRAKIKIDMSGDWNTKISFDGPLGKGETSFSLTAR